MRTRFLTSAAAARDFPKTSRPEVCFVGRSNVGKSSLLNRIAGARTARTSKTPGRTRLINFFEVTARRGTYVLADLPGYGYAEAPKTERAGWLKLIQTYVERRNGLSLALLLIDLRRGIQEDDARIFEWIRARREVIVVGTKCDKLGKAQQKPARNKMAEALALEVSRVHLVSAASGQGIEELKEALEDIALVGQTSVDGVSAR
jgi:GTP-binding protein